MNPKLPRSLLLPALSLAASVLLPSPGAAAAATITGVSIPVGSNDQHSWPLVDNIWSVSAPPFPLNTSLGIGHIIDPSPLVLPGEFSLHDHVYAAANVPDPTRAVITYTFSEPTVVDQLLLLQHLNGVTAVEGFVGASVDTLVSIGTVFGLLGDVTLDTGFAGFAEGQVDVFDFNNSTPGSVFRVVVRKTSNSGGYSNYRAYPADPEGVAYLPAFESVPEVSPLLPVLVIGGFGLWTIRRRA